MGVDRRAAEGFGRAAAAYERGRPGYPQAAIDWMVAQLGIRPDSTVVDLGAGTGKFRHDTRHGCPGHGRRAGGGDAGRARPRGPRCRRAGWNRRGDPVRGCLRRCSYGGAGVHWFNGAAALSEIHRVLRPAGGLGLIWNRRDTRDPRQAAIDAIIRPYRRRAPTHERDQWREPMLASTLFRPADERRFRHEQTVDLDGLIDRVLS